MPLLLKPIILSLWAGVITLIIPKRFSILRKVITLVGGFLVFFHSVRVFSLRPLEWFTAGEVFFSLDGLSAWFFLGLSLLGGFILFYSLGLKQNESQSYYPYLFWTIGLAEAAVLANNMIGLIAFWGFLGLVLYLLLNNKKFFIMVCGSNGFLILGLAILWKMAETFSLDRINIAVSGRLSTISFICLLAASLSRPGIMPFPGLAPSSFLLVLLYNVLGLYLLARMRFSLYTLGQGQERWLLLGAVVLIVPLFIGLILSLLKIKAGREFGDYITEELIRIKAAIYEQGQTLFSALSRLWRKIHPDGWITYFFWIILGMLSLLVIFEVIALISLIIIAGLFSLLTYLAHRFYERSKEIK